MNTDPKPAISATLRAHAALAASLPADTGENFADARRGFIDTVANGRITDAEGRVFWNMGSFAFENDSDGAALCPPTVDPNLWRQAHLNLIHGLFEVAPPASIRIRSFDISNITFIEGETGYIIIDRPMSSETAALALLRRHRGDKPVTAVIYTHSQVDHYGGVRWMISDADIEAGLTTIAPEGFLEAAVVKPACNVMNRRATSRHGPYYRATPPAAWIRA